MLESYNYDFASQTYECFCMDSIFIAYTHVLRQLRVTDCERRLAPSMIYITLITPRACARSKVIGFVVVVVVSTKIAKSQKIGVWLSALCHQTVENREKLSSVCFKSLRVAHEHYKSCIFTGHAYRPHLPKPCGVSIAHARS